MRIGVVGGGASGMMAAITAAGYGAEVTIIEHTGRVGKKLLSTGNGKCNFTNQKLSKDDYNGNHPSFVEPVLAAFGTAATIQFFEDCGMLSVSKRDGYFYPYTGQASTVQNILRYKLESLGVIIKTETYIKEIRRRDAGGFVVKTDKGNECFDKLILACGGNAAPGTGSDGSGYKLARAFGHKIFKPLPVLTYLKSREPLLKEMAGVRVNAELSLYIDGVKCREEEGELQLNKDNLSGIPVFQLSHDAISALDKGKKVTILVDFIPCYSEREAVAFLRKIRQVYADFPVSEAICGMLHKKVCGAVLHREGIRFETCMRECSEDMCKRLVSCMKKFKFEITSHPGFEAAQATMGGVDTTQVDENLMSRLADGLYFAGEILDIDGRCGGYNLQWAFSSGYVAGCHSVNGEVKCYESISAK